MTTLLADVKISDKHSRKPSDRDIISEAAAAMGQVRSNAVAAHAASLMDVQDEATTAEAVAITARVNESLNARLAQILAEQEAKAATQEVTILESNVSPEAVVAPSWMAQLYTRADDAATKIIERRVAILCWLVLLGVPTLLTVGFFAGIVDMLAFSLGWTFLALAGQRIFNFLFVIGRSLALIPALAKVAAFVGITVCLGFSSPQFWMIEITGGFLYLLADNMFGREATRDFYFKKFVKNAS
jgi:hypothetical protein